MPALGGKASALPTPAGPQGLTDAQVDAARQRCGRNALPAARRGSALRTLGSVLAEPMFLLLLFAAGLYLAMGDRAEGVLLSFFALATIGLVVVQERRSERAVEALRVLAAPQARAWHNGTLRRVAAADLVPGDLVALDEGERVPADGLVRDAQALMVDESLLTGESVPVRKAPLPAGSPPRMAAPGGDDNAWVFAGSLVVRGHALVDVTAIGSQTEMGRIGESLATVVAAPAPMARQLRRIVQVFASGALAASLAVLAWHGLVRHDWMNGLLSGIALAMAMLPEEFPMALSIFLALGSWRLARAKVLVRHAAAIDSLGAVTTLCLDKTGTLTRNELQVAELVPCAFASGSHTPADDAGLLEAARLSSRRDADDPLDRAVFAKGSEAPAARPGPVREYPLVPGQPLMAQAWTDASGVLVAAKGAPEAIADLCHLGGVEKAELDARVTAMAAQGLRAIAVAQARAATAGARLADHDFALLGLIGFLDPLREGVATTIAAARRAGIQVVMITGDHVATALAIARQAGIDTAGGALSGVSISAMEDTALARAARTVRVFARVTPDQKLRLVRAFQANGEIVAMTGDGVNDAPALKAAQVGIAMGMRGTDVAREAASIVLLDDDVARIVDGVGLGRRIFDNLRKVMMYITAIHVPIVGAALLPLLLGMPPLLLPVHVVITEMVIDPMCSLVFEGAPASPTLMSRPPRSAKRLLVDARLLTSGFVQGAALLLVVLGTYALSLRHGSAVDTARALAILALTAGNVGLVLVNTRLESGWRGLADRQFTTFWLVAGGAATVVAAGICLPGPRALLHFGQPSLGAVASVIAAVVVTVLLLALLTRRMDRRA